ncbi:MAG: alpha,alpha-trehalose-phosphate synthase (UDP-forming) [Desulfomonilia bacterium]
MKTNRLAVISNRLPIVLSKEKDGTWSSQRGSGGLVTALGPVLRDRDGLWIGWLGAEAEDLPPQKHLQELISQGAQETGYALSPVNLTREEVQKFYYGFSNEILWPLFHDMFSQCNFNPDYWEFYQAVNRKFAAAVAENTTRSDYVWVHDYHLILLGRELKKAGVKRKTGYFLHVPFPPLDIFLKLPWRFEILEAFLEYDLVGFQTVRDRRNFIGCVRALLGYRVKGRGHISSIQTHDNEVVVGAFPISIDFNEFSTRANTQEVAETAWIIHANLPRRQLILGVDRLDYTKGIPLRLLAYEHALATYPELRRNVTLVQVVVPSRRDVEEYERLKQEIERLVGEINGRFTQVGWTPIQYIFRSLSRSELVSYYRTCEIALITPLKDGMNLVAKEYCASKIERNGVLILSEFAGAASQLYQNALLVNPYDREGVARAIHQAYTMDQEERKERMNRMRRTIQRNNIFTWVRSFLRTSINKDLNDFPQIEFFVPSQM